MASALLPSAKKPPHLLRPLRRRGESGERADRDRDLQGGGVAAAPDKTGVQLSAPCPLAHDLVHETAQSGLALRLRQDVGRPEVRPLGADGTAGGVQGRREGLFRRCPALGALLRRHCGRLEGLQGHLPGVFQLRCDMAMMRRINVAALAFTRGRGIAQPLQMLRLGVGDALGRLLPLGQRLFVAIEFHRRQRLDKRVAPPRIDRSGRHILTHGSPILVPQGVTDGAGPALILDHHLGAACPAVDKAMPEGFARARAPTGFVAIIRGVLVCEHGLHRWVGFPSAGGRGLFGMQMRHWAWGRRGSEGRLWLASRRTVRGRP
jgi:hypothetical protein